MISTSRKKELRDLAAQRYAEIEINEEAHAIAAKIKAGTATKREQARMQELCEAHLKRKPRISSIFRKSEAEAELVHSYVELSARERECEWLKGKLTNAEKRYDEANERLAEILEKRIPLFSQIMQKLSNDEALFFLRLFSCRPEMVNVTVFKRDDIPEYKATGKYLPPGQVQPSRQKAKVGRWRLPYGAEIAREMDTSEENVSQRRKRLFDKFPAVKTYYYQTERALNDLFEKARIFEATQDSLNQMQSISDGKGGYIASKRLTKPAVDTWQRKSRQSYQIGVADDLIKTCLQWKRDNSIGNPHRLLIDDIRPTIIDLQKLT